MRFNGIKKDYVKVHLDLMRPPSPNIEFVTWANKRGGSRTKSKRFEDLVLPVPVTIIGNPTIEDINIDLTSWLIKDEPKKLSFSNDEYYYLAEYESIDLEEKKYRAKGFINFHLADGHRHGLTKTISLTPSPSIHEITGQLPTNWTSETVFTSPQSSYTIESATGLIKLTYEFIQGDVLEVDGRNRSIKLNGVIDLNVGLSLNSQWFDLKPNYMTMKASHATVLTYVEKYY